VAVVVSFILITSDEIISTKHFRKTLSGLETSFYMWCFIAFLPPLKRVLHFCETKGAVSTVKWMVFGPVDVAHYEKFLRGI
jgi:hypothetical protein